MGKIISEKRNLKFVLLEVIGNTFSVPSKFDFREIQSVWMISTISLLLLIGFLFNWTDKVNNSK